MARQAAGNKRAQSKSALGFILAVILLDTIGFGIIAPVLPELIRQLNGGTNADAAEMAGYLMLSFAVAQFICAPIIGSLSDRFGRRPVLLASLAAFGLDYLVMGFAPTLFWLFIGRIVAGIAGGSYVTANAYIADIATEDNKARLFGYVGAAWGTGFIIGPMLGGIIGAEFGVRAPFFAASALALTTFVFGFLVVPETLKAENRRPFTWARAHTFGAILHMRAYPVVFGLLFVHFLFMIAHDVNPSVWSYYTIEKFNWTAQDIGYSLAAVGVCSIAINAGLVGPAVRVLGNERTALVGMALAFGGMLMAATANSSWEMVVAIPFICMMGLASPPLRAIMSDAVPPDTQGELQGAVSSVSSLVMIIAPVMLTQIFYQFSKPGAEIYFPGAPYLLAGILMAMALFACVGLFRRVRAAA